MQDGPLSVPVSLSYHASGVKVAEMASWVGLNWNLNVGGAISRTIQGIADEGGSGLYNNGVICQPSTPNPFVCQNFGNSVASGFADSEPDIFTFNFGGYSGKFYFDKQANGTPKVEFIPKQDIKLKLDSINPFSAITLITPDGNRYIFGKPTVPGGVPEGVEYSKSGYEANIGYPSTWNLTRIESADAKYAIDFEYQLEYYKYVSPISCKQEYRYRSCSFLAPYETQPVNEGGWLAPSCAVSAGYDSTHSIITTDMVGQRLVKIKSPTSVIEFQANTTRLDLESTSNRLDSIKVYAKNSDGSINNNFCFKYVLSYDYHDSPTPVEGYKGTTKRLKLNQVQKKSCDGSVVEPPYEFTYQSGTLPFRLSKQIDHWGYYNGQTANENKLINIPPTTISAYDTSGFSQATMGTSNREPNEDFMKIGVLTNIKYPTGGNTAFVYEANRATITQENQALIKIDKLKSCTSTITQCCGTNSKTSAMISFATTNEINNAKYRIELTQITNLSSPPSPICANTNFQITVQAYHSNGTLIGTYQINPSNFSPIESYLTFLANAGNGGFQPFQDYYFVFTTSDVFANLTVHTTTNITSETLVGGLRVKTITTHDGVSTANNIIRNYEYTIENDIASSGKLIMKPSYAYVLNISGIDVLDTFRKLNYAFMFSEDNLNNQSGALGYSYHIGYARVKEILKNGSGNDGYSVYRYSFGNLTQDSTPILYPRPPFQRSMVTGELLGKVNHNANGNQIAFTANTPTDSMPSSISSTFYYKLIAITGCNNLMSAPIFYKLKHYLPSRLLSVQNYLDGVLTTTSYSYDNTNAILAPLTSSFNNSDGKTTIVKNKYITHSDYATDIAATKMKALNIISEPVEVFTEVAGVNINGSKTEFSLFDMTTGLPSISSINSHPYPYKFFKYKMTWDVNGTAQVLAGNNGWDLEGTITKYDILRGRPATVNLRAWENATEPNATEKYTWETNGLIKSRTFKGFLWQYEYFPNTRLVSKIIDKDGQFVTYVYDKFMRVKSASARAGAIVTDYTYTYQDAPQSNRNWIETKTTFSSPIGGSLSGGITSKSARQYMDGLGRPVQSVAIANSPTGKDVISVVAYDNQGRESLKYDPFESTFTNGAYVPALPSAQPFTKVEYEPSPLSRTWKVTPPGWQPTITEYGTNAAGEAYDMTTNATYPANSMNRVITTDPDGRVTKSYTDRKGRKTFVLNLQNNVAGVTYMIYQFDDKDRLKIAFTPRNTWQEAFYYPDLDFKYFYDLNDNIIEKRIPDQAAVYLQYNLKNQLVLSQDGNQRSLNQWLATQYDDYGRPSASGFATSTALNATTFNPTLSTTLTAMQYSTTAGVELGKPIRTYNYYGTYLESLMQYDNYGRLSAAYSNNHLYSLAGAVSTANFSEKISTVYDLADNVLTKVRTHKPNATTTRTITETTDYDNALRLKRVKHQVDAMAEQIVSQMDYTVKNQLQTKWMGKVGALSFLQKVDYAYNSVGFLTGINAPSLNGTTNAACTLPFANPTGSLDDNDLFSLDMRYDNPTAAFAPTGTAATPQYGGNIAQMIWQVRGKQKQVYTYQYDHLNRLTEANYSELNTANVKVDNLNKYMEKLTYDVRGNIKTLQRNGAIDVTTCQFGTIDNLQYFYNNDDTESADFSPRNRLRRVSESSLTNKGYKRQGAGGEYTYDANGNLKTDPNKGITNIVYNYLNLPERVEFGANKRIEWLYDAGGRKLRKTTYSTDCAQPPTAINGQPIAAGTYTGATLTSVGQVAAGTTVILNANCKIELNPGFVAEATGASYFEASIPTTVTGDKTDYADGIEYNNGTLQSIYHSEGRVTTINGALKYEYALKDHLGNTRLMFSDKDNNGIISQHANQELSEVSQENHYYAFGMAMEGNWMNTPSVLDNKYQYNGKELNEDFGLNWNDYGARFYDATLGKWNSVDPMADAYQAFSPYAYVLNNPIRLIDPNGMYSEDPKLDSRTDKDKEQSVRNTVSMLRSLENHYNSTHRFNDQIQKNLGHSSSNDSNDGSEDDQVEQKQTSVIIWAATGDVGHTAIRVGDIVYGYYPTDINGDNQYTKEDLDNSPGEMHIQNSKEFTRYYKGQAVKEFVLNISPKQTDALVKGLDAIAKSPGTYELKGRNCTSVTIYCLKQAQINITYAYGRQEHCYPIPTYLQAPWDLQKHLESPCNTSLIKSSKVYNIGQ
jgi:RHS repeat-associated protein